MAKRTVKFDAQRREKGPAEVEFNTKDGKHVDFVANVPTRVPVHVRFKANDKKK